jgi:probable nitrogen fixation protein
MTADTAIAAKANDDGDIYRESLVKLMRAHDSYGAWEKKSDEEILKGFVLTKEQRRAIPVIGEPDWKVLWRLEVFYTAVSYAITRRTGLDTTPIIKISGEGFGRVMLTVGRLVVLSRSLRDVHRFGFESTDALAAAGEAMVAEGIDVIERFPAVAYETD